jgi:hypothetical protein
MPATGMDRRVYLETKFGGPGEVQAIHDRITVAGVSARGNAMRRVKRERRMGARGMESVG